MAESGGLQDSLLRAAANESSGGSVADVVDRLYTQKLGFFRKPVWSMAALAICLIVSVYTMRGSSEDLEVWDSMHGELFDRFFEQIPLSILFGYLLFRTINPLTGKSAGWNWPQLLFYFGGGAIALYIVMHEVSHFANDDVVTANKRREKITQIAAQSLIFGGIFMWLGNGQSVFSFLNRKPGTINAEGKLRRNTMYVLLFALLSCISANDINLMRTSTSEATKSTGEAKKNTGVTISRAIQYCFVIAIIVNAFLTEAQIQKATTTQNAFGNLINLASTDSLAQASPINAQSGYEI